MQEILQLVFSLCHFMSIESCGYILEKVLCSYGSK